jgi:hydroxyacylglutathione hydrolase
MMLEQYYLGCLSQASYLIGDETSGRAAVVDPRRDIDQYLADAGAAGLTIEFIIETHFHADFLSGHLELAAATGAEICFGPNSQTEFQSRALRGGERISLGEVILEIRHTPGHTPESISIVVWESPTAAAPHAVLTGDALFIGDVGRPDLLSSAGVTADTLAGQLFDSLHQQLLTLPDATLVYPAHGAGSACGKNLSTDTQSTIGEQRATNYALAFTDRDSFVQAITEGQPTAPAYFSFDAKRNREAHALLDEASGPLALTIGNVQRLRSDGAVVLDTRDPVTFARGHLRGSVNVGLEGRFSEYTGGVVPHESTVVLVSEPGTELEAKNRLGRIGFDRVAGYLADPAATLGATPEDVDVASRLTVAQLSERTAELEDFQILDIRGRGEAEAGMIEGAQLLPLPELRKGATSLDPKLPTVVYCAGGYRSSIGASLLRQLGFSDVSDLVGGYAAWDQSQSTSA